MAFAIRLAIDNTFSFSNCFSSGIRIVFVTHTSSIGAARSRSIAGPTSSACVANAKMRLGARAAAAPLPLGDGAGVIDHVVGDQHVFPLDFADDVHDFRDVRRRAPLVDDRERRVQPFREAPRHLGRPDVRCDHHRIVQPLGAVVGSRTPAAAYR